MSMAEWLLLRLPRGPEEHVSWMPADGRGQPLAAPQSGALAQAAAALDGRRLAVIVPSSDVLMTEVELPAKSGNVRIQQIVPYALEEQLAADIETLHFALGSRDAGSGRTHVAVVNRALMDRWTAALTAAGLTPELICTGAALVPDNPGHVVVLLEDDTLCVRRAGHAALALPALEIGAGLSAALGAQMATEDLIFYVAPEDWQRRGAQVESLRSRCASLRVQLLNFGPLPLLAPRLAAGAPLNLLSGDYAPKRTLGGTWQRWRVAAMLTGALLVLHVGGLSLQLHQQHRAEQSLNEAIGRIARQALPGDPGTGDVRARIEQRLTGAAGANAGLMPALDALAQAVKGVDGISIESLSFQNRGIDLRLRTRDAEQLDHVDQSLRSSGWHARIISSSVEGSGYEGRIQASAADAAGGSSS
jgi:general secretion pathway protein L